MKKLVQKSEGYTWYVLEAEIKSVLTRNFCGIKGQKKILEELKRKVEIFLRTKNIFNFFFYNYLTLLLLLLLLLVFFI